MIINKNRNLVVMMVGLVCLFLILPSVSAEMWFWTTQIIDNSTDTINSRGYYQFEDTSPTGIGKNKDIPITLVWTVEALPYDLGVYGGEVDWCNFTVIHFHHIYGTEFTAFEGFSSGQLLNTTTTVYSNYTTGNTSFTVGELTIDMRDRDSLIIDMKCHYNDSDAVYPENVLVGRYTTYFGANECNDCEEYSLEELSNEIERQEETIAEQTAIYEWVQSLINMNYTLWLIASWLVKISFVIVAVTLIFIGVYYLYKFFQDIEQQI